LRELDISKDIRIGELYRLLDEISRDYGIDKKDILKLKEYKVPIECYNSGLSTLEIFSKYLFENKGLKISQIANLLFRSRQNISQAYRNSKKKYAKKFLIKNSSIYIPAEILQDKRYSALQNVTLYLFDLGFTLTFPTA